MATQTRTHGSSRRHLGDPTGRATGRSLALRRASVLLGAGVFLGQCSPSCAPQLVPDEPLVSTTTAPAAPPVAPAAVATTVPTTVPTGPATTAAPASTGISSTYFGWIGVGGALPTGTQCTAAVRSAPRAEVRPRNATPNATTWRADPTYARVDGNFTGSTDDLIRWAACKWGFDEDVLRAQVVRESYWSQFALGDWTTNAARCAPGHGIGVDGRAGQCPESVGLMQVRAPYFPGSIDGAIASSAYNLDVSLAVWRSCYEGQETWLNNVERGRTYAAGDQWGCIGRWLAGRWYTADALTYIGEVQTLLAQRAWTTSTFLNATP
ncbi:MAG: hypothetical protein U0Q03_04555 [Acidimicrobiales bacterium]